MGSTVVRTPEGEAVGVALGAGLLLLVDKCAPLKLPEPSPDGVNPLAGELGDTEAKVGVPLSARPRFDTKCLDLVDLPDSADGLDRPGGQNTPSFMHGVVDTIDFETDWLVQGDRTDLAMVSGAEDDVTGQRLEVDQKGHWPPGRSKDDSPDASPGQQFVALFLIDGDQMRIGRRVGSSVGTALFSTEELRDRRLECECYPQQS